jgi:hypothetical protein
MLDGVAAGISSAAAGDIFEMASKVKICFKSLYEAL